MAVPPGPGLGEDVAPAWTHEQECAAWHAWRKLGDATARLRLIDHYLPFTRLMAAKVYRRRLGLDAPFADYLHAGIEALIRCVDRFDTGRGYQFKSYAQYRIECAILDAVPSISEQHAQASLACRLRKERAQSLEHGLAGAGRYSRDTLFAQLTEISVGLGLGYMLEGTGMLRGDEEVDRHDGFAAHALQESIVLLRRFVALLPWNERVVIRHHYFFGMRFEEIAHNMKLSKGRISQLHKQALQNLRVFSEEAGLGPER